MKWPTHGRKILMALAAVAIAAVAVWQWPTWPPGGTKEEKVTTLAKDEIVVVRTVGGRLQVSTLIKNEEFRWQTSWTCPFIDCGELFGKTVSEVRVPVHYTFAIPMASEWQLKFRGKHFELRVPKEEPNLPPGLETSKLEIRTSKGWTSPDATQNQISLLKQLGPELARRAVRPDYASAQRDAARKTVAEFARKWMAEQSAPSKNLANYPIKVFFADEPVQAPAAESPT
jgi:hypothetical protein